jgi:hypothetical protein
VLDNDRSGLKMTRSNTNCLVGTAVSKLCRTMSCDKSNNLMVQSLRDADQRLLFLRTGQSSLFDICSDHVEKYVKAYTFRTNKKFCCDPDVIHKNRVNCALVVNIDLSDELSKE